MLRKCTKNGSDKQQLSSLLQSGNNCPGICSSAGSLMGNLLVAVTEVCSFGRMNVDNEVDLTWQWVAWWHNG